MPTGCFSVYPNTAANNIGLRNLGNFSGIMNIYITAGNEGMQVIRNIFHYFFVQGQLQRQQRLIDFLPSCPTENRNRDEHFSRRCISRQASALSSCVNQYAFFSGKPFKNIGSGVLILFVFFKQPGSTSSRSQLFIPRIGSKKTIRKSGIIFSSQVIHHMGR